MSGFWAVVLLAILGVVIYACARGRVGMQKEYRDEAQGLADLLRYARPIEPGIVLGKGGELIAGYFYRGTDTESASNSELEAIAALLNDALRRFGSGWMVHIDASRSSAVGYPEDQVFPSAAAKLMDLERERQHRAEGAHFESVYAMTFTYLPPLLLESRATAMMYERSTDLSLEQVTIQDRLLTRFKDNLSELEAQLSTVFEGISRMTDQTVTSAFDGRSVVVDHLAGYIHYCVTGISQHIVKPPVGVTYDTVIGSQDFVGGNLPRVGQKHVRCVSIEGFPAQSFPGILGALNSLPVAYRWNTRFIFMDPEEGKGVLNRLRKKWRQKIRGFKDQVADSRTGPVDVDAAAMEVDAVVAMGEAGSGLVRYGHYTSVIVLMGEDTARLKQAVEDCATLIRNLGFTARIEDLNAVEAFLGTFPGHGYENVRRPILHSLNLAHLIPTTATWPGLATNPCSFFPPDSPPLLMGKTSGNAPFRFNLHVDDVGHTLMLGPTGAGKSTHLELIEAAFMRYPNAKVRKFEKGYSSFILCNAVGGTYYDIGGEHDQSGGFCPLGAVDRPSERAWATDYIETLLKFQGIQVKSGHTNDIREGLILLGAADADRRSMTDFLQKIKNNEIREALKPYTLAGDNPILDAQTDNVKLSPFTVFEMEHLMSMGDKRAVPVLLYLFRCVERGLDGSPTLLVLDEAWLMLNHPLFQEKIREWLKVLRKANCAVLFATQSVSDVGKSQIRDVLFESCPTKILLANPEVRDNEDSANQYRAIGLNERQIDIIGRMAKKLDYYYMSPLGRRKYQLGLGPVNLAFTGASGKEDIAMARSLIERHGERWTVEWLRHCRATKKWADPVLEDWAKYHESQLEPVRQAA
ncbi:Type IV secretion system protein virB4 [Cupriavidus campinensis]|uniref:Transporter n=2 Tax=Cupriavidus campinensis TaxID=151783 RepID=A0ABY3EJ75_9BURK|nr:transporter [Cupriavidus campinensis]CAG2138331.1 Type IV secretion system protein virB4 [Cupriavidus campinensis]